MIYYNMSSWVSHVKKVASEKGISYKEAMTSAKSTYTKATKTKEPKETKAHEAGESKMPGKKKLTRFDIELFSS